MKLKIGQTWISKTHPHEDFEIYDGVDDSFVMSDMELYGEYEFDELPETAKIFFWKRVNDDAFHEFIVSKKGENYDSAFPYANCGECKKGTLVNKIKKYNMKLVSNDGEIISNKVVEK